MCRHVHVASRITLFVSTYNVHVSLAEMKTYMICTLINENSTAEVQTVGKV